MKRKLIICFIVTSLIITSFAGVSAATKSKTASNSRTQKSWVGIPVYKIGIKGDYCTDGKKLSKWSNARCNNATYYPGWSCKSKKAKWVVKEKKSSKVRNNSTFFYGLDTQWITVGLQSYDDEISATVKP
ncbi:hypothetical protein [Eubacterium sp.]